MIIISRFGNTAENNGWLYPKGVITQDTEAGALRLHDALTPGGWVLPGTPAKTVPGPGPGRIAAGTPEVGYCGITTSTELITGDALASLVGITAGTEYNSDVGWLKYTVNGTVLYFSKKPYRYNISWSSLNNSAAVTGNTEVLIGDNTYRVRLLTGGNGNPATGPGGEWNQLLYPVHVDDPSSQGWGVNFTNEDLGIGTGDGKSNWCVETVDGNSGLSVARGQSGPGSYHEVSASLTHPAYGWRPVLELVDPTPTT